MTVFPPTRKESTSAMARLEGYRKRYSTRLWIPVTKEKNRTEHSTMRDMSTSTFFIRAIRRLIFDAIHLLRSQEGTRCCTVRKKWAGPNETMISRWCNRSMRKKRQQPEGHLRSVTPMREFGESRRGHINFYLHYSYWSPKIASSLPIILGGFVS